MEDLKRKGLLAIIVVIVLIPIIGLMMAAGRFPVLLILLAAGSLIYSLYARIKVQKNKTTL